MFTSYGYNKPRTEVKATQTLYIWESEDATEPLFCLKWNTDGSMAVRTVRQPCLSVEPEAANYVVLRERNPDN